MNYKEFYKELYFKITDDDISMDDFKKYAKIISKDYREKYGMTEDWLEFHNYFKNVKSVKDKDVLLHLTSMFKILYESYNS